MNGTKKPHSIPLCGNQIICIVGGTAWESNPADHTRWSQAVLKTVEGTSTPISPVKTLLIIRANWAVFKTYASFLVVSRDKAYNKDRKIYV
ncbi:hypothetical protein PBF_14854 [Cytobacillus firmus DS1]|uniref:Uncharacterized protein n=1 Tax=Cytobacillus firmus DS1 TaxID=1307436 RepID=W7L5A6_CYTFI|nr:hypothetical protein PBF_14854 [Cytobacillus firmus DS1]